MLSYTKNSTNAKNLRKSQPSKPAKYPLGTQGNFDIFQFVIDPKLIDGALRSAIHAHGPITLGTRTLYVLEQDAKGFWSIGTIKTCSTSSASKRIRGAIKTRLV